MLACRCWYNGTHDEKNPQSGPWEYGPPELRDRSSCSNDEGTARRAREKRRTRQTEKHDESRKKEARAASYQGEMGEGEKEASGVRLTRIVDFIVDSLLSAERREEPFRVLVLKNILPGEEVQRLLDTRTFYRYNQSAGRDFAALEPHDPIVRAFNSERVSLIMSELLDVNGKADPRLTVDRPNTSIVVHPDVPSKSGTLQVYLDGDEDAGTVFHRVESTRAFKVPFGRNLGYAFKRTDTSFHSVDLIRHERWSLIVPFFATPAARS